MAQWYYPSSRTKTSPIFCPECISSAIRKYFILSGKDMQSLKSKSSEIGAAGNVREKEITQSRQSSLILISAVFKLFFHRACLSYSKHDLFLTQLNCLYWFSIGSQTKKFLPNYGRVWNWFLRLQDAIVDGRSKPTCEWSVKYECGLEEGRTNSKSFEKMDFAASTDEIHHRSNNHKCSAFQFMNMSLISFTSTSLSRNDYYVNIRIRIRSLAWLGICLFN